MVRPPALSDPVEADSTDSSGKPDAAPAATDSCRMCGATLTEDQEWCLECGAARTAILAPPDWRIGVGIMLAVVAAVVLVVVIVWP